MRAILLLFIASACLVGCDKDDNTDSGNMNTWLRIYPNIANNLIDLCQTSDGGYGAISVLGEQTRILWFDRDGELTGETSFSKYLTESARAIASTNSGELLLAGYGGGTNSDMYVARTNGSAEGAQETRLDLGSNDEMAFDIMETTDDCLMICGRANGRFTVAKLSNELDTMWTKTFGAYSSSEARALAPIGDNFVVVGISYIQALIIIIDLNGSIVNERYIEDSFVPIKVDVSDDNEIFVAGTVFSEPTIVKFDDSLNIQYSTTLMRNEYGYFSSLALSTEGQPIVLGSKYSNSGTYDDIWIAKLDEGGQVGWTRLYLTSRDDYGAAVVSSNDGGMVILGSLYEPGDGQLDLIIAKLNSQGEF